MLSFSAVCMNILECKFLVRVNDVKTIEKTVALVIATIFLMSGKSQK